MVVASVMVSVTVLRIQLYLSGMILLPVTIIMYLQTFDHLEYFKRTIKVFH